MGKAFGKQRKTIEDTTEKQNKALETLNIDQQLKSFSDLFSNDFSTTAARDEIEKIKKIEQQTNRDDLIYKTGNEKNSKAYDFQKFKQIRSFGREMYNGDIELNDALEEQITLKNEIDNFNQYTKSKSQQNKKEEKLMTYEKVNTLLQGRQKVLNEFESKIFPLKPSQGKGKY